MFYKLSSLTSYLIGVMLHISGQPYGAFFNLTLMSIQFMALTNWLSTLSTARQCVGPHAHLSNKKKRVIWCQDKKLKRQQRELISVMSGQGDVSQLGGCIMYMSCMSTSRVFWCDALNTPTRASLLPQRLNMCKQAARHTSTFSQPLHSQNMGPEDFTLQKYFEQHVLTTKHHDV